jgi:hypothetical protein
VATTTARITTSVTTTAAITDNASQALIAAVPISRKTLPRRENGGATFVWGGQSVDSRPWRFRCRYVQQVTSRHCWRSWIPLWEHMDRVTRERDRPLLAIAGRVRALRLTAAWCSVQTGTEQRG